MSAGVRRAALVAVGDELLAGAQVDSNSGWEAGALRELGIATVSIEVVGDDEPAIAAAVRRGLERAELVLVGGGLGPTLDDVSRHGVAAALGLELREDPVALADVAGWFERRGITMSATNRRQALLPEGARLLRNRAGTAACFVCELGARAVMALPGPPRELHVLWEDEVVPWLRARGWTRPSLAKRTFHLFGLSESVFAERAGAWMARDAEPLMGCTVRQGCLTATLRAGSDDPAALTALERRAAEFAARFEAEIYSDSEWALERVLAAALVARDVDVTLAESCTGGLALELLTRVPGISARLSQGFVTYSNAAKEAVLGVPPDLLRDHGAVSREVAAAMALGAARVSGARLALAITGIAGPDGGTEEKPVGLVWLATALDGEVECHERRFPPVGRDAVRAWAARTALFLGWRRLRGPSAAD